MTANASKRHHYVPQYYLRQFACADDRNKVSVVGQHGEWPVADRKSINRIGSEDALHDYVFDGEAGSIEDAINRRIETPFAASGTWTKVLDGRCELLNVEDRLPAMNASYLKGNLRAVK